MRPEKRRRRSDGVTMELCHVRSPPPPTRRLHLNAWQQARRDDGVVNLNTKKRKGKGEGLITDGKRKSYFGQRRFG